MTDVLVALAWLVGALALVALLVWGSLRGAIKAARVQRKASEDASDDGAS